MASSYGQWNKYASVITIASFLATQCLLVDSSLAFADDKKNEPAAVSNVLTSAFSVRDTQNRQENALLNVQNLNTQAAVVGPLAPATITPKYLTLEEVRAVGYRNYAAGGDPNIGYEVFYAKDINGKDILNNQGQKLVAGVNEWDKTTGKLTKQCSYAIDLQKGPCQVLNVIAYFDAATGNLTRRDTYQWDTATNRSVATMAIKYDSRTGNVWKTTRYAFDNSTLPNRAIILSNGSQAITEVCEFDPNVKDQMTKRTKYQITSNVPRVDASGNQLFYSIEEFNQGKKKSVCYYKSNSTLMSSMQIYQADGTSLQEMETYDDNGLISRGIYFWPGSGKMKSFIEIDKTKNVQRIKVYSVDGMTVSATYEIPMLAGEVQSGNFNSSVYRKISDKKYEINIIGTTRVDAKAYVSAPEIYIPFSDVVLGVIAADGHNYYAPAGESTKLFDGHLYPSYSVTVDEYNNIHVSLELFQLIFYNEPDGNGGTVQRPYMGSTGDFWEITLSPSGVLMNSRYQPPSYTSTGSQAKYRYYNSDGKVVEEHIQNGSGNFTYDIRYYDNAGKLIKTESYYDFSRGVNPVYTLRSINGQTSSIPAKTIRMTPITVNGIDAYTTLVFFEKTTLSSGEWQEIFSSYDINRKKIVHQEIVYEANVHYPDEVGRLKMVKNFDPGNGKPISTIYYSLYGDRSVGTVNLVSSREDYETSGKLKNKISYDYFPLVEGKGYQKRTETYAMVDARGVILKDSSGKELVDYINSYVQDIFDEHTRAIIPHHLQKVTTYNWNSSTVKSIEEFNEPIYTLVGYNTVLSGFKRTSLTTFDYYPGSTKVKSQNEILLDNSGNTQKDSLGKDILKTKHIFDEQGNKAQIILYQRNVAGPIADTDPKLAKFTAAYSETAYHVDASGAKKINPFQITLYAIDGKILQTVTYNENNTRPIKSEVYDPATGSLIKSLVFDYVGSDIDRIYAPQERIVPYTVNDSRFGTLIYPANASGNLPSFTADYTDVKYKIDNAGNKIILSKTLYAADGKKLQEITYDEINGRLLRSDVFDPYDGILVQSARFDSLTGLPTAVFNYDINHFKINSTRNEVMSFVLFEGRLTYKNSQGMEITVPKKESSYVIQDDGGYFHLTQIRTYNATGAPVSVDNGVYTPLSQGAHIYADFDSEGGVYDGKLVQLEVRDHLFRNISVTKFDSQTRVTMAQTISYQNEYNDYGRSEVDYIPSKDGNTMLRKEWRGYDDDNKRTARYVNNYDANDQLINTVQYNDKDQIIGDQPAHFTAPGTYPIKDSNGNEIGKWVVTFTNLPTYAHKEEKFDLKSNGTYLLVERREFGANDHIVRKTTFNERGQVLMDIYYMENGFQASWEQFIYSLDGALKQKISDDGVYKKEQFYAFYERLEQVKTYNHDTGKLAQVDDYNTATGRLLKSTGYDADGKVIMTDEYATDFADASHVKKEYVGGKLSALTTWDKNGGRISVMKYKSDGVTYNYLETYSSGGPIISKTTFYPDNKVYRIEEYKDIPRVISDVLVHYYYPSGKISKIETLAADGTLIKTVLYNEDGTIIEDTLPNMKPLSFNLNGVQASIDNRGRATVTFEGSTYMAQVQNETMTMTINTSSKVVSAKIQTKANGDSYCASVSIQMSSYGNQVEMRTTNYRENGWVDSQTISRGSDGFHLSVVSKTLLDYDYQGRQIQNATVSFVEGGRYNHAFSEWQASYTLTDWTNNIKTLVEEVVVPADFLSQFNSAADYSKINDYVYVQHRDKYQDNSWAVKTSRTEYARLIPAASVLIQKAVIRNGQTYWLNGTEEVLVNIPSQIEDYNVRVGAAWQIDSNGKPVTYLGYGIVFEKNNGTSLIPAEVLVVDYPFKTEVELAKVGSSTRVIYTIQKRNNQLTCSLKGDVYVPLPTTPAITSYVQTTNNNAIISASIMNMPNNATPSLRVTGPNGYNRQFNMQPNGGVIYGQAQYMSSVNSLVSGGYSYRIEIYDPAQTKVIASSQGNFVINYTRATPCNGTVVNGVCIDRTTTTTTGNRTNNNSTAIYR